MCIAVLKPAQVNVRKKTLKECFANNPDGVGFAYPSPDQSELIIVKGYFHFRSFWEAYREIQATGVPMLIHFRIATSGKVDQENCHPWRIDENHALIHNGVLEHKIILKDENISDSGLFTQYFFKPIFSESPEMWLNPGFKWLIEESIGFSNKIVVLRRDGEFVIFNERQGEWDAGVWFSNKSYKEKRVKKTTYYAPVKTNYALGIASQEDALTEEGEDDIADFSSSMIPRETAPVEFSPVVKPVDDFFDTSRVY